MGDWTGKLRDSGSGGGNTDTHTQTCERGGGHELSLTTARVDDVLLDQVASDLHHRVERALQDLLRPVTNQLARRLCHFLFVGLDQLGELRLETKRNKQYSSPTNCK